MEQASSGLGPHYQLRLSTHFLSLRDFTNARNYALLAKHSDPTLSGPDEVLAVANVLLATTRRLPNNRLDFYSILQARPGTDSPIKLMTHFESLVRLLNPAKKNMLPFSDAAFNAVNDAWIVLSDPEKKTQYDKEINFLGNERKERHCDEKVESKNGNGNGTFWTVCPYCYWLYEYEKVYEECCLRCQHCNRAFHGVAVKKPGKEILVEGKDEYFCGFGFFPLQYRFGGGECHEKCNVREVVDISDDSDDENGGGGGGNGVHLKSEEVKEEGDKRNVKGGGEEGRGKGVLKRVKTVARKSKKVMGRGARVKSGGLGLMIEPGVKGMELNVKRDKELGSGSGSSESDFEFFERDGDVFVGLKSTF